MNLDGFGTGLAFGLLATALGVGLSLVVRRWNTNPALHGVLLGAAALLALAREQDVPRSLVIGAGLLMITGVAFRWTRRVPLGPSVAAAPGAAVVAFETLAAEPEWLRAFVFGLIVVGGPMVASFSKAYSRDWSPALLAGTVFGAFVALPDTEEILPLLGVALPLALLAWPVRWAATGAAGATAVLGVYAWVAVQGSAQLVPPMIGAAGALGLFVVEPLSRWVGKRRWQEGPFAAWSIYAVVAFHGVVVFLAGRVAGTLRNTTASVVIATATLAGAAAGLLLLRRFEAPMRTSESAQGPE